MKKIMLITFLLVTSLLSKETITWIKWDLPPNFILKGKFKNQGWADKRLKIFQKRLTEYNHKETVVNLNKFIALYKEKDDSKTIYCTNDIVSHPSLDIDDYLSIASFPFEAHYLLTTKEKAKLFPLIDGKVDFAKTIKNRDLKLVISKNRPYLGAGKLIKEYLEENPNQTHISSISTLNIGKSMYAMVMKGRADYTILR